MISDAFDFVVKLNEKLIGDIAEISVKASQISIMFDGPVAIPMQDIVALDNMWDNLFVTDITTFNENMFISFRDLHDENFEGRSDVNALRDIINELRQKLCTCPALEFVISPLYLKIFLDIPNVKVKEVYEVEQVFGTEGYLELNDNRPYVLYINEHNENI